MEFTPTLSAFQGVIISADNVHSFSKLTSKGGNEDKIQHVIDSIKQFLLEEKYINEQEILNDSIMRKFAFYIVINSDLPILEKLVDLEGLEFVIWTIPIVPKHLMCEFLWRLYMGKYIYETIMFSCPQLGLQLADALIDNLKYESPLESLPKLPVLFTALYNLMCRFVFFNLKSNVLKHAFNNCQKILEHFKCNKTKLENAKFNTNELYKFMGQQLSFILCLLRNCFTAFTGKHIFKQFEIQQIYELTYKENSIIEGPSSIALSDCNNNLLLECINNTNTILLDACRCLLLDVSVEIFCAWSEFVESGKSMQDNIGELCHKLHEKVCKIASVSDHPVVAMLQQLSSVPKNFKEIINIRETSDIVENISTDNNREQWVKALLYKDKLCEDATLMEQIAIHLELLNETECHKLFRLMQSHLKSGAENKEDQLLLAIRVFQRCSGSSQLAIVEEHFNDNCFNDTLQTTEFTNMMTEIFNKLIDTPIIDVSDILTVFLQNPRKVYIKIFTLASENLQQMEIMLKVMVLLEKFEKYYYNEETEPCIIMVVKEIIANILDTDLQENYFIRFLTYSKIADAIQGQKLLLLVIMPNLHSALLHKDMKSIYFHCKLLHEAYTLKELIVYRAPTLAMLAQILDNVRWKLNTYTSISAFTLELVLKIQTYLLATYESIIPEKESTWLKRKLRNINPLNMYYFKCLWNPPGNTFVEVTSGIHIHRDMDIERLTIWLSQIIYSTIVQEWFQIWDNLTIFRDGRILDIFHDAILLIFLAEKSNHTATSKKCLLYCIRNFVATIRYKFFKVPIIDNQIVAVFKKLAVIENLVEESDVEELVLIYLPLLGFLSATKTDIPVETAQILLGKVKHKLFHDKLQDMLIRPNM